MMIIIKKSIIDLSYVDSKSTITRVSDLKYKEESQKSIIILQRKKRRRRRQRWSRFSGGGMEAERRTLVLVYMANIMERADEVLLPAVYKEVGAALHATPTGLGSLTLLRSVVQTICYPLAAYMATRHDRTHVIAAGAFLWAAATFLVAISTTFFQVAISRALNGIGLALVLPSIQSLVADSTNESNRGLAFGWLQLAGNAGAILGNFLALLLASTSVFSVSGWRIAFHLVGLVSVVVGILVRLFAVDPHFPKNTSSSSSTPRKSFKAEVKEVWRETKSVLKIPTFQIIVAQGILGSFPWSAFFSFAPMWMELVGFSHGETGMLMTLYAVASSLGGLFGGKMGDILAKHFPNAGRIILSQISAGSVVPSTAILFLSLPYDPSSGAVHALVLFIMGLFASWNAPATNSPIFAEIVQEKSRTSVYALDRSFESTLASFAPPLVGVLVEHVYGYKSPSIGSSKSESLEADRENAASLAKALFTAMSIPITLCSLIYSFLYCTYPRDRQTAKMNSLITSELQLLDLEDGDDNDEDVLSESQIYGTGKGGKKIESEADDDLDEKRLLSGQAGR